MFDVAGAPGPATAVSRDAATRALLYAATALSYLASAAGDPLAPAALAFLGAAAAWSLAVERRLPALFFPPPLKIGLIVAGSIVLLVAVAVASPADPGQLPRIVSRFLLWNAGIFMLSRAKTEHDLWIFAIIDLSFFMIGGTFQRPGHFLVVLPAALLCLLGAFHRSAVVRAGSPSASLRNGAPAWRHFRRVAFLALLVFLLFPRRVFITPPRAPDRRPAETAAGDEPAGHGGTARSGLSKTPGHLDMTGIGEVKNDPTPVLALRLSRPGSPGPLRISRAIYLRQETYDGYDGRGHWSSRHIFHELQDAADGKKDGKVSLAAPEPVGASIMIQRLRLSDPKGVAMPLIAEPTAFTLPSVVGDLNGTFMPNGEPPVEYEVTSSMPPSDHRQQVNTLVEIPEPPVTQPRLDLAIPRMAAEARALVEPKIGRLGKVEAIERFLLSPRFRYTLKPPPVPAGADPIEMFVGGAREGYCVHFAGALTLMCRSAGIPARMASGLLIGTDAWDEAHQCYVGRNSDAHAWTEVWFGPANGWIIFDPTPAASTPLASGGPPRPTPRPMTTTMPDEKPVETPPSRWDRSMTEYDGSIPEAVIRGIGSVLSAIARAVWRPVMGAVVAVLAVGLFLAWRALPRGARSHLKQRIAGFPAQSTVDFYQDFLWALSTRGLRKPPGQTPAEFAEAIGARLPRTLVDPPTRAFYRVRFGGEELGDAERRKLFGIAREIEAGGAR